MGKPDPDVIKDSRGSVSTNMRATRAHCIVPWHVASRLCPRAYLSPWERRTEHLSRKRAAFDGNWLADEAWPRAVAEDDLY
eukprot:3282046-Pyramimonas_sp.AAC.1